MNAIKKQGGTGVENDTAETMFPEDEVLLLIHAAVACPDFYDLIRKSGSVPRLLSVAHSDPDGGAETRIDMTTASEEIGEAIEAGKISDAIIVRGRKEELN